MDRSVFSTPGFILMTVGALVLLWFIGKVIGASFFFICFTKHPPVDIFLGNLERLRNVKRVIPALYDSSS